MSLERVLAAIALVACIVLLGRLAIGETRRWRFDAAVRRAWRSVVLLVRRVRHWRSYRRDAAQVAEEAIQRARRAARTGGEWDGNVYKPKSFRKPPRDKMH